MKRRSISNFVAIILCFVLTLSFSSCVPSTNGNDRSDYNPPNSNDDNSNNSSNSNKDETSPDNNKDNDENNEENYTGIESSSCFTFELNSDGNSYTLTGRKSYDENNLIIDYHNGKPVTKIAKEALDYGDFSSVYIGNSVTTIEKAAFKNCDNLTTITIPGSVTKIGDSAFENCSNLSEVILEEGVTTIGCRAFRVCYALKSISLPDTLTYIEEGAFEGCNLKSVYFGSGIRYIGEEAFYHCLELEEAFYPGTEEEWKTVVIENYNFYLTGIVHYNYTSDE